MHKSSDQARRGFWLKHLHRWHWISSAFCLVGMLLFAATGLTLNNASHIEAKPSVLKQRGQLPSPLLPLLKTAPAGDKGALPSPIAGWLAEGMGLEVADANGEWSADEVYVSLPRAGGDAWLTVDRASGEINYELTDRGWVSYFNDLHKGRHTGKAWSWFIDVFAVTALVFCITGLFLLHLHAGNRPATWPLVGLGLVLPLLLAILFIH